MSCRIFIGRPLEFGKFASNVLELPILSRNAIRISTGRPLELLTGRPQEQKIWRNVLIYLYDIKFELRLRRSQTRHVNV